MDPKKVKQLPAARACLLGTGLTSDQIDRPLVAVVYSENQVTPGHLRSGELAKKAAEGILSRGGTPLTQNAGVGVCDGIAMGHEGMKYSLPSRELNANAVETMIKSKGMYAGIVFIAGCDKHIPGYLMAAARLNLPSIFITVGPMLPGFYNGKTLNVVSSFEADALYNGCGGMTFAEYSAVMENSCPGPGSCAGLFTANSMACVTEALGMSLPGMATAHAVDNKKLRLAFQSGEAIMDLIINGIKARDVMTSAAFRNALTVDMAIGASTNTVLHIPAIALEANIGIDLDDINNISKKTPNLVKISPSSGLQMLDFERAGGVPVVMKELYDAGLLEDTLTVTNVNISSLLRDVVCPDKYKIVIRGTENPHSQTGGIMIMGGNLALDGAVIKMTGVNPETDPIFEGKAVVFNNEEDATAFIKSGNLKKGQVLVIRYVGLAGAPGMPEMLYPTSAIKGLGMDKDVALITDGRFSGGTAGICIGHAAPEAWNGGVIALVNNGDMIAINLVEGTVDLQVNEDTLTERKRNWVRPTDDIPKNGILGSFRRLYETEV